MYIKSFVNSVQENYFNASQPVVYIKKVHDVKKPKSKLAIYIFIAVCVLCGAAAYWYYTQHQSATEYSHNTIHDSNLLCENASINKVPDTIILKNHNK